jgi:hypothetical protein
LKVGGEPLIETLSLKIRVGGYVLGPRGLRGNAIVCEPGKGKGKLLARRRRSTSTKLEIPKILLVSWETVN